MINNKVSIKLSKNVKLVTLIFLCLIIYLSTTISNVNLSNYSYSLASPNNSSNYAKAHEDCILYKTNSMANDLSNIYFIIPPTYFVKVISTINDDIYKIQYSSFVGFCYANKIDIVSFTPDNQILNNITFSIKTTAGTQIWSLPTDLNSNKFTTIPAGTTNIEYIAFVLGDIPNGGNSNIWYYARYTPVNNSTSVYEGYVYSEATENLSNIPNNLETENITTHPPTTDLNIDKRLQNILLILICLPFITILIIGIMKIIRSTRNYIKEKHNAKETPIQNIEQNPIFIKKSKQKFNNNKNNTTDNSIEVVFPEYDYIDDDDLL